MGHFIPLSVASPAWWSVLPFVLLLVMIATGPLFYRHFWEKNYAAVSAILASIVVCYYIFGLKDSHPPVHSMFEFISFIALIAALFVASGSISIYLHYEATPAINTSFLIIGALLANFIGTTGASILLIKPFMRMNRNRLQPYLIVFFIFIISNGGGSLTPIGDPPLFLGFLKGVPFFWTLQHLWLPWIVGVGSISLIFFFRDRRNKTVDYTPDIDQWGHATVDKSHSKKETQAILFKGKSGFFWFALIIGAVFIDPNVMDGIPTLKIDGMEFSFIRESIMIIIAITAYSLANKKQLKENNFNFAPIKEVGFLFVGIFATMMPALQLVSEFANSDQGQGVLNTHFFYWATGTLTSVLDNAPTYLNFLAAAIAKEGLNIESTTDVAQFANTNALELSAISIAAVFFGAMTYIGNAPNFMVRTIAEQTGTKMPSFIGYVWKYAIPYLLPVLILLWLLFVWLPEIS